MGNWFQNENRIKIFTNSLHSSLPFPLLLNNKIIALKVMEVKLWNMFLGQML